MFGTPVYLDMPTSQFQLVLEYMCSLASADFRDSAFKGKTAIVVSCTDVDDDSLNVVETVAHSLGRFGIVVVDKMIYDDRSGPFKDNAAARAKAVAVGSKFSRTADAEPVSEILRLNRSLP